jgi:predicted DsbA family dithiol-disulfide isomerase
MSEQQTTPAPSGHTPEGGVLVGSEGARRRAVVYEDAQCPYCRRFEQLSGDLLRREVASGSVALEYRMRSFLGPESVRASNALALAAEQGRFDQLRTALFEAQPAEGTGGFTADDLVGLGASAGLGEDYAAGVREGRFTAWVLAAEDRFAEEDPDGTPMLFVDGERLDPGVLYDPEALGAALRG